MGEGGEEGEKTQNLRKVGKGRIKEGVGEKWGKKKKQGGVRVTLHARQPAPQGCCSPVREVFSLILNSGNPKSPAHVPTLLPGSPSLGHGGASSRFPDGDLASLQGAAVRGSQ